MTRRSRKWRRRQYDTALPYNPLDGSVPRTAKYEDASMTLVPYDPPPFPGNGTRVILPPPRPSSYGTATLGHVVLLGDSIIDNGNYTDGKPDVAQRLHSMLGDDWRVSLLASDGATTRSLHWQLRDIPRDATALVVSIGGNDANGESRILRMPDQFTLREALEELYYMGELFAIDYAEALEPLLATDIPLTVCTIYQCDFPPEVRFAVAAALAIFNDVILQFAFAHNLNVLDLRTVCTEPEDYEMTIEPSAIGGAKIARAIAGLLLPVTAEN